MENKCGQSKKSVHLIKIVQQTITACQRIKVCKAFRTRKPATDQLKMQIHTFLHTHTMFTN